jgi:hypothetical protein
LQLNKQRVRDKLDANTDEKSGSGSTLTRGDVNSCPVGPGSLFKRVHDEEGEADSIEKAGSGLTPTRGHANLCPVGPGSLVKRVHDEEGEADSMRSGQPQEVATLW